jgi:succinate dehydrogenase / fumarate reductase cytochrome b subunit
MESKTERPVFLNLLVIRLPAGAVLSILHRVTGVLLVLLLPLLAYLYQTSLRDEQGFRYVVDLLRSTPVRAVLVLCAAIAGHHFFSGIRHLLLDLEVGIARQQARVSAWLVFALNAALTMITAWWLL